MFHHLSRHLVKEPTMTKRNQKTCLTNLRTLDTAELAAATGGYTLTLSYDLSTATRTSTFQASLENALKPANETSSGTITNTK
jgi:hypothetical protein